MSTLLASPVLEEIFEMAVRRAREPDGEWNLDILAAYGKVAGIRLAPRLRGVRVPGAEPFDVAIEFMADGGREGARVKERGDGASRLEELFSGTIGAQVQRDGAHLLVTDCPLKKRFGELGLPCVAFCGAMRRTLMDLYHPTLVAETARSRDRCRVGVQERPGGPGTGAPGP